MLDVHCSQIGGFNVREVIQIVLFGKGCQFMNVVLLNCGLERIGEAQDQLVSRRLREVNIGWRGWGGIVAVQCLVQVANVGDRGATDHASLLSAGKNDISWKRFQI